MDGEQRVNVETLGMYISGRKCIGLPTKQLGNDMVEKNGVRVEWIVSVN